jgi:hypothetical protein
MLEACFSEQASFSVRISGGGLIGPFKSKSGIMVLMIGSMAKQTDVCCHFISTSSWKSRPTGLSSFLT